MGFGLFGRAREQTIQGYEMLDIYLCCSLEWILALALIFGPMCVGNFFFFETHTHI